MSAVEMAFAEGYHVQAVAWYNHLTTGAAQMRELTGVSDDNLHQDLDTLETESIASSASRQQLQRVASNMSAQATGANGAAGGPQTLAEISVGLGEIALYVSGQTCKNWWPDQVNF